jgi:hypothetical protein
MEVLSVELKKNKYTAYFFDGTKESAKELSTKLSLHYVDDFLESDKFAIVLPNNKRCYANNYIVTDDFFSYESYNQSQFIERFTIVNRRSTDLMTFMSED